MNLETMLFELQDNGIGILTFNRPEKLNAISFQFVEDFHEVLDNLITNLDCRILILRGDGRAFCSGLDLNEFEFLISSKLPENYENYYYLQIPEFLKRRRYYQHRMSQLIIKMRKINQPIIALIQGPAIGGGFTFAMASDIRIISQNAIFNIGSINIGMAGGDLAGSYFLPRQIGMSRAAELMLTGRNMNADEAERIGFIYKIVEEDKLLDAAIELAEIMLSKSPLGIRMTKEVINISRDTPSLETIIKLDNRSQLLCGASRDIKEATKAFAEKRIPKYPFR